MNGWMDISSTAFDNVARFSRLNLEQRSIFLIKIKELSAKCFELTRYQYDVMQINLLYSHGWLYSKIIRTRYNNEQRDVKEVKILLRQ